MNPHSEQHLVLVKNFPSRTLAEAARVALEKDNIMAILQSLDVAGITGILEGCDLYVDQKDFERARELLESLYDGI